MIRTVPSSAKPRRVLWLLKGLGRGGTEQLVAGAVGHVDPSRYEVEVAYVLPWKDAMVPDIARHVPVHCLGASRSGRIAWVPRLRRLVAQREYDIIHTHMPHPAVAARLVLPRDRILIHTEHNMWQRYRRGTYLSNALTYRRNAAVLAVSRGVAESIRPLGPTSRSSPPPVHVLIHGIDLATVRTGREARTEARARLSLGEGELVVGTVGNFTAKKDHRLLVGAVALLHAGGLGARLVLVGSGPLEDEVRREVERLGLRDAVLFTGSRSDVPELLPGFDVFALSSRHEGLPIALLEAMAAGVPPVATRVGGVPEVIEDGVSGVLVEPGDVDELAAALTGLLADPTRRSEIGSQAAVRGRRFELAGAVARLQDLYDSIYDTTVGAKC